MLMSEWRIPNIDDLYRCLFSKINSILVGSENRNLLSNDKANTMENEWRKIDEF